MSDYSREFTERLSQERQRKIEEGERIYKERQRQRIEAEHLKRRQEYLKLKNHAMRLHKNKHGIFSIFNKLREDHCYKCKSYLFSSTHPLVEYVVGCSVIVGLVVVSIKGIETLCKMSHS